MLLKNKEAKKEKQNKFKEFKKSENKKINQNLYINDSPSLYDIDIDFVNF